MEWSDSFGQLLKSRVNRWLFWPGEILYYFTQLNIFLQQWHCQKAYKFGLILSLFYRFQAVHLAFWPSVIVFFQNFPSYKCSKGSCWGQICPLHPPRHTPPHLWPHTLPTILCYQSWPMAILLRFEYGIANYSIGNSKRSSSKGSGEIRYSTVL